MDKRREDGLLLVGDLKILGRVERPSLDHVAFVESHFLLPQRRDRFSAFSFAAS